MSADLRSRVARAVRELLDTNEEYAQVVFGEHSGQVLGPPSRPQDLATLQARAGFALPPSYRAFLELHDGWRGFDGEVDLLSAADRTDPQVMGAIEELLDLTREEAIPEQALFIAGGRHASQLIYLDGATRRPDGEMDVVEFGAAEGELDRYPDIVTLMEKSRELLQQLIAQEKGQA
jgi:hypothetical protein